MRGTHNLKKSSSWFWRLLSKSADMSKNVLLNFNFWGLKLVRVMDKAEQGNYCSLWIDLMSGPQNGQKLDFHRQLPVIKYFELFLD